MSMDSATSESFQSSNGGGAGGGDFDDFDSRAPPGSISSFLNPSPPQSSRSLFNPFPSSHHTSSFLSDLDAASWPPPPSLPPAAAVVSSAANSVPTTTSSSAAAPRTSKKRARASRRAPTTVLTTDTSNFRAMVQEFTGIPAPPFATSSSFSRPRLDLLHSSAAASAPSFLLRPFAQKLPPALPSSAISGISSNTLPSTSSIQNPNFFFNTQDPVLNLQSMLQEQQRAVSLCQWPATGYAAGELGSVIAGASVDGESNRIGSCKSDHSGSSHPEKQPPEGFASAAASSRGDGGVDAWQLSSD